MNITPSRTIAQEINRAGARFSAWLHQALPGDYARLILHPIEATHAVHGQPISPAEMAILELALADADIALIRSTEVDFVLMSSEMLTLAVSDD